MDRGANKEDRERGLLVEGTRFRLRPGQHHAVLIRDAEAKEALHFEVEDDGGATAAIQKRSFQVGAGR